MPERYLDRTLGRYQVRALVGAGGFSWVYRAYDTDLEIDVALKILKPHYAGDAEVVERFRREATTAARLRHPNIVTVLAVGREGDAPYVAMDLLPGSLAARLAQEPVLPEAELLRVGMDVARALSYAHTAGVVHRDIKVDNVLLDASGNAVVADFGIARALADAAAHSLGSAIVGTPQYFSPEQARGLPLDGRTDIYALGVTLYRAATGALPFVGDDWYAVMRQHIEVPAPSPRDANPSLSPDTEEVILRCLEKEPDARYADAEGLCRAMEQAAARLAGRTQADATDTVVLSRAAARRAMRPARSPLRRFAPLAAGLSVAAVALTVALRDLTGAADADAPPAEVPTIRLAPEIAIAQLPPLDSTRLRSDLARVDSTPRAPEPDGALEIRSAEQAQLYVDGRLMGRGRWSSRSLRPRNYAVSARLQPRAGFVPCPTLFAQRTVLVQAGAASQVVELPVRPCGRLRLDIAATLRRPTYMLLDDDTRREYRGTVSSAPVVLPAGRYLLVVDGGEGCSQYTVTLEVPPDGEAPVEKATLICP